MASRNNGNGHGPKKSKADKRKGSHDDNGRSRLQFTRFALPEGDGWAARVARGLAYWREENRLTIPEAVEKYSFDQTLWYRTERGVFPQTTAKTIDRLCNRIGVDIVELLKSGT